MKIKVTSYKATVEVDIKAAFNELTIGEEAHAMQLITDAISVALNQVRIFGEGFHLSDMKYVKAAKK